MRRSVAARRRMYGRDFVAARTRHHRKRQLSAGGCVEAGAIYIEWVNFTHQWRSSNVKRGKIASVVHILTPPFIQSL